MTTKTTTRKGASPTKVDVITFTSDPAKNKELKAQIIGELCITNKDWRKAIDNFQITGFLSNGDIRRSDTFTVALHKYTKFVKNYAKYDGFIYEPGDCHLSFWVADRDAKAGAAPTAPKIAALKAYLMGLNAKIATRVYAETGQPEIDMLVKLGFAEVARGKDDKDRVNIIMGLGYAPKISKESAKAKKARLAAEAKVAEEERLAAEAAAKKTTKK
jgi:hypothetical protein